MKAMIHKLELVIVDLNMYGLEDAMLELSQSSAYQPYIIDTETVEIDWSDDHPLNNIVVPAATLRAVFEGGAS